MYKTYILYSELFDKYYIGHTDNIDKRLERHNNGSRGWTKSYRPWIVIYTEEYHSRSEAMQSEKYLKSFKNKERLKKYIAGWRRGTSRGS